MLLVMERQNPPTCYFVIGSYIKPLHAASQLPASLWTLVHESYYRQVTNGAFHSKLRGYGFYVLFYYYLCVCVWLVREYTCKCRCPQKPGNVTSPCTKGTDCCELPDLGDQAITWVLRKLCALNHRAVFPGHRTHVLFLSLVFKACKEFWVVIPTYLNISTFLNPFSNTSSTLSEQEISPKQGWDKVLRKPPS